jgi:hypothetical protein
MGKYTAQGRVALVTEAPASPLTERWVKVKVKFQELMPELVRVIGQGDEEKDLDGKTWGRLVTVLASKPSDILVVQDGKMCTALHPCAKDLEVFFELLCIEKNGEIYYKGQGMKMGNRFIFSTTLYSISGVIVGVER